MREEVPNDILDFYILCKILLTDCLKVT